MSDTKNAYFVIADISGYTKFMAETEINHAKGIIEDLFAAILPLFRAPMAISGLQGDAVFAYAFESEIVSRQYMVDLCEAVYCTFARRKQQIAINSQCTCGACSGTDALDLKIIVHHGECVIQETAGRKELAGPDVITAFRLLKNGVKEKTGLSAYALMTCDAVKAMHMEEFFDVETTYTEEIEHIGSVEYVVHSLAKAWQKHRELEPIYVSKEANLLIEPISGALTLSPDAVFPLISQARHRTRWIGADKIEVLSNGRAKVEPGDIYHCHHGSSVFVYQVLDWQPGKYLTGVYKLPFGLLMQETIELTPSETGTEIEFRYGPIEAKGFFAKLISKFIMAPKLSKVLVENGDAGIVRLQEMCDEFTEQEPSLSDPSAPLTLPQEIKAA